MKTINKGCQCCGNIIQPTSGITMYWLQGNRLVYNICFRCWAKPFLKALFLNQQQDLPNDLVKKYGLSLGYTKEEIKAIK